ncbi:MAG TPA: hypothetical protein VFT98_08415 [Myxococcota bacterium]|nr:hypothetical protein [Myxococcota bacterium]
MKMAVWTAFGLALASLPGAASFAEAKDQLELQRDVLQAERKLLVSQNLELTETEAKAFWPAFDEYAAAQRALNDRLVKAIDDFGAAYDAITDDKARELLEQSMTIREDRLALRRKYLKRFASALPGKKLARFYQIDNKLDTLLDFELARALPLVH